MKKFFNFLNNLLSNLFLITMILFCFYAVFTVVESKKTGEQPFVFGYRPVYILSASMEPTIATNSIVIVEKSDEGETYDVGDIVLFNVYDETDKQTYSITHRVYSKLDDYYIMKGDNNEDFDNIKIYDKDIVGEVVFIWNWFAMFVAIWATTKGKILITSGLIALFVFVGAIKMICKSIFSEKEKPELKTEPVENAEFAIKGEEEK